MMALPLTLLTILVVCLIIELRRMTSRRHLVDNFRLLGRRQQSVVIVSTDEQLLQVIPISLFQLTRHVSFVTYFAAGWKCVSADDMIPQEAHDSRTTCS